MEFALVAPLLLLLALGVYDLGHVISDSNLAVQQMRIGLSTAQASGTADVGATVRASACGGSTAFCLVPNNVVTWGAAGTGQIDSCAGAGPCGDPAGCAKGSSFWTIGAPIACFAVGFCPISAGPPPTCSAVVWGSRAPGAYPGAVVVRVVLKMTPATPLVRNMVGTFYIARVGYGAALY